MSIKTWMFIVTIVLILCVAAIPLYHAFAATFKLLFMLS